MSLVRHFRDCDPQRKSVLIFFAKLALWYIVCNSISREMVWDKAEGRNYLDTKTNSYVFSSLV